MIITKTPFRMSFFGGGTDMEEYFKFDVFSPKYLYFHQIF